MVENTTARTSVSRKILAISFSFALPIGVLAWLMVDNINSNIEFARKETQGIAYLRPLNALLETTGDHWLARQRCADGEPACVAQLDSLAAQAERAFAELQAAQAEHGEALQFTTAGLALRNRQDSNWEKLQAEWRHLAGQPRPLPRRS